MNMMAKNLDGDRLNIRIEIKNNAPEQMDVDEYEETKSEEEGEIRDSAKNGNSNFITGDDSALNRKSAKDDLHNFIQVDQKKLQDRAIRFSLKPEEINTFTEDDLNILYISLGITSENIDQMRFEAVHLRSSDELTLKDVTNYFIKYAPNTVEMVDSESCNVVWDNKLSAARALFQVSQVVKGMPVRVVSEHVIDSFILDDPDLSKEPVLINENREIELTDESAEEYKKLLDNNSVDISAINIPIPPGYWRLGRENIHSYSVLLRFSMITDKKPQLVEKCSKYLKAFPRDRHNHQSKGIFSRNKDIKSDVVNKDPWGILAKTWNEDFQFREHERYADSPFAEEQPLPVVDNPELRVRLTAKRRLGSLKSVDTKKSSSDREQSEESDRENVKKVSKVPRMRMYADEEEEKIKRKKLLLTLKHQKEKIERTEIANTDLRNILGVTNRKTKVTVEPDEEIDLSVNLKNRRNKLVFTVAQDASEQEFEHPTTRHVERRPTKERKTINERKPRSPIRFKRNSPERYVSSRREPSRERLRSHDRSRHRKISLGGMYSTREEYSHKPRSKVALVIKTQKKPSVASTIRSRSRKYDTSSSSSSENDSSSSDSSESEESSEESDSSSSSGDSDSRRNRKYHSHTKRGSASVIRVKRENNQR